MCHELKYYNIIKTAGRRATYCHALAVLCGNDGKKAEENDEHEGSHYEKRRGEEEELSGVLTTWNADELVE